MPRSSVPLLGANLWPRELKAPRGRTVHIWKGSLDRSEGDCRHLAACLDAGELQRASRFRFPLHRSRFMAGRGLLRSILALYLQVERADIEFEYSAFGKPKLKGDLLHFNVAHSEQVFVLAVSERPVGVDIEVLRPIPDQDSVAGQVCSSAELEGWTKERTVEAFLSLWTRKEALLKALGLGVTNHLKDVSVFFDNDARIELGCGLPAEDWTVRTIATEEEIWSIAVPFQNPELSILAC